MMIVALMVGMGLQIGTASAAGQPWYNDLSDCRSRWNSAFDTCRIRHDADARELQAIDPRLTQAQTTRDAAAAAAQGASGLIAQLDARLTEQRDVAIPTIASALKNAIDARDELKAVSQATLAETRALVLDRGTMTAPAAAGLAMGVTDPVSLGLVLDGLVPRTRASEGEATKPAAGDDSVRDTDFGRIFDRLLSSNDTAPAITLTIAQAAVDDEAALDNAKASLASLESDKSDGGAKAGRAARALSDAESQLSALKDRKKSLPDVISSESDCMTNAADYRDNRCSTFWAARPQ